MTLLEENIMKICLQKSSESQSCRLFWNGFLVLFRGMINYKCVNYHCEFPGSAGKNNDNLVKKYPTRQTSTSRINRMYLNVLINK
jgi:hypothetical protein